MTRSPHEKGSRVENRESASRCSACPVLGPSCPAALRPTYCDRVQREPQRYGPILHWRAREALGVADPPPPHWAYSRPMAVAAVAEDLAGLQGRWLVDLIRHVDQSRMVWTGLALIGEGLVDEELLRELNGLPVIQALPRAGASLRERRRSALRDVGYGAAAVLAVGIGDLDALNPRLELPTVVLSMTSPRLNGLTLAGSERTSTRLAGLSRGALRAFTPKGREHAVVMPMGVDPCRCTPRRGRSAWRAERGLSDDSFIVGLALPGWSNDAWEAVVEAVASTGPSTFPVAVHFESALMGEEFVPTPHRRRRRSMIHVAGNGIDLGDVLASLDVLVTPVNPSGPGGSPPGLVEAWIVGVPTVEVGASRPPMYKSEGRSSRVRTSARPTSSEVLDGLRKAMTESNRQVVQQVRRTTWERLTVQRSAESWVKLFEATVRGDDPGALHALALT